MGKEETHDIDGTLLLPAFNDYRIASPFVALVSVGIERDWRAIGVQGEKVRMCVGVCGVGPATRVE
jgi:hypothetical protein